MKKAIEDLVKLGVVVSKRRWQIYQSERTGEYVLLNFNGNGDLMHDNELVFSDLSEAVETFMEKVGLE